MRHAVAEHPRTEAQPVSLARDSEEQNPGTAIPEARDPGRESQPLANPHLCAEHDVL